MLRPILRLFLTLLTALAASGILAAGPPSKNLLPEPYRNKPSNDWTTVWYCAYGGNATIHCRLGLAGSRTIVQGTARNPDIVSVARKIIEEPETLANRTVIIPLRAPPFEFKSVGLLAESVMCGTRSGCGIIFGESPSQLAPLVRQHETEHADRLLMVGTNGV